MARRDRMRTKQLHFSDSGSRFGRQKRYSSTIDPYPISKTFTRKVMYCKRCQSRVVSNVSHCPYCGKSLLPLQRRFWFWLIILAIIGATVAVLLFFTPGVNPINEPPEPPITTVVGAPEGTSFKNLDLGTGIEYNKLRVTFIDFYQVDVSSNNIPIIAIEVEFLNTGTEPIMLTSPQWQLQSADGTRADCFIGKSISGESIHSELGTKSLGPGATYTTILYFAVDNPLLVLFAPNPLSFTESELVTWKLAAVTNPTGEDEE